VKGSSIHQSATPSSADLICFTMYVYMWMYFYLTIINLYTARVFPEFLSTEMDVGHQSFEV